jgi:putative nucleotidyltransferase with HDIG domain
MPTKSASAKPTVERTRRDILHACDHLPPLPDFVVHLLSLLARPDCELRELERCLQADPVLVARMLALVHSPLYGHSRPVRTIQEAVMVLGFRGVRSLVLAASSARMLQRDYACYGHEPKGLWTHASAVAAAARELALRCMLGSDVAEQLFVAGLLHDIGKMVLAPYLMAEQVRDVAAIGDCATERATIGLDHTEAGALVCAKWNLPVELQDLIKAHHDSATTTDVCAQHGAVLRLADALAHEAGFGYLPGAAPLAPVEHDDLVALGLTLDAWQTMRSELIATMELAIPILQRAAD